MKQKSDRWDVLLIYAVLALTTFVAFEQVRRNDFVDYDDQQYVTENAHIKAGITRDSVLWAFTTPYAGNWHPLTWLSHMLDYQLFGLDAQWHHMTSLLFHIANTLLLFWVLKQMTGAVWPSGFVAAAFALHPLHVESVAWVAERKDVLSGFFWMLTTAAYIRYTKRPGIGRYLLVFLGLGLGLMSKPMLVTLPFVLLLLDYWPLGRLELKNKGLGENLPQSESGKNDYQILPAWCLIVEKIPLFILVAASSATTFIVQQVGGVIAVQQKAGAVLQVDKLPLYIRFTNALVSYVSYIAKMIYPSRLAVLYPHPTNTLPTWQPIVCFAILAVISAVTIYTVRQRRYLIVGWLWYIGTLVPVIGLVQVGSQAMADRYTYLPSIGIFIMLTWGAVELLGKWRLRKIALRIVAWLVIAALLMCTRIQVQYWQNSLTLFGHAIEATRNNYIMLHSYGYCLNKQGRKDEAIAYFNKALQIYPQFCSARRDIGIVLLEQGKLDEAIVCFNEALRLRADWPELYSGKGTAYYLKGSYGLATQNFDEVLGLKPDDYHTHFNIGMVMVKQGNYDKALKHFNEALRINPQFLGARANVGVVFLEQGKYNEAIKQFEEVLRLDPSYPEAIRNLRIALNRQNQVNKGKKVSQLKSDYPDALLKMGTAMARQGKYNEAVKYFNELLRLKPDSIEALNNLAWMLASTEDIRVRNPTDAVKYAERACELTLYKNPSLLDTLAVAYAAAGRFSEAAATAENALELAQSSEYEKLTEDIRSRLQLYKAKRPYRRK